MLCSIAVIGSCINFSTSRNAIGWSWYMHRLILILNICPDSFQYCSKLMSFRKRSTMGLGIEIRCRVSKSSSRSFLSIGGIRPNYWITWTLHVRFCTVNLHICIILNKGWPELTIVIWLVKQFRVECKITRFLWACLSICLPG